MSLLDINPDTFELTLKDYGVVQVTIDKTLNSRSFEAIFRRYMSRGVAEQYMVRNAGHYTIKDASDPWFWWRWMEDNIRMNAHPERWQMAFGTRQFPNALRIVLHRVPYRKKASMIRTITIVINFKPEMFTVQDSPVMVISEGKKLEHIPAHDWML